MSFFVSPELPFMFVLYLFFSEGYQTPFLVSTRSPGISLPIACLNPITCVPPPPSYPNPLTCLTSYTPCASNSTAFSFPRGIQPLRGFYPFMFPTKSTPYASNPTAFSFPGVSSPSGFLPPYVCHSKHPLLI